MMKPLAAILLTTIFSVSASDAARADSPPAKQDQAQPRPVIEGEHLPLCGTAHLAIAAQNFRSLWRKANLDAASGDFKEADCWYKSALQHYVSGPALHLYPLKDEIAYSYARLLRTQPVPALIREADKLEAEAKPNLLRRREELEKTLVTAQAKSSRPGASDDDKYSTFVYEHLLANMDRCLREYDKAEPLYKQALSESSTVGKEYDGGSLKQDYAVLLYWTDRADQARKLLSVPEQKP